MRRARKWLAAMVLAAAAGAGYLFWTMPRAAPQVTFVSISGEKVAMHSLRGKVVIVNFWATSCAVCVREMPQMVQTYDKYKHRGLDFVAVAMRYDAPHLVLNYAQTRKLPFKVVLDARGELAGAFGEVSLTPTTFVIGRDGRILKRYVGEPEFGALHQLLEKALAS